MLLGDTNGFVKVWDTQKALELTAESSQMAVDELCSWKAHNDCTNGVRLVNVH